jgi:hypothetical protein
MYRHNSQLFKGDFEIKKFLKRYRDVAQFGSAPALGAGCRGFESLHPDQFSACSSTG